MKWKHFRNLTFRKKMFVVCMMVSLIPVTILGGYCYREMNKSLINREKTALHDTLIQESNLLEARLIRYVQAARYTIWNNNIKVALHQEYDSNADMYLFNRDTLDPLVLSTKAMNPDIDQVTLYTNLPIYPHGKVLRPLKDLETMPWYEEVCADYKEHWFFSAEQERLYLVGQVYGLPDDRMAVVKVEFNYNAAFASMQLLYENAYGIVLTDSEGNIIYQYQAQDLKENPMNLEEILEDSEGNGRYMVETANDIYEGWSLHLYRPIQEVLLPVRNVGISITVMIFLSLFCVTLATWLLSSGIVKPLEKLAEDMKKVEQGVLVSTVTYDADDEIGVLTKNFTDMVNRLNILIEEVIKEKMLQKEYEMRALQAQINPHFLYNSLSLINSKALICDQQEIAQMAQHLSVFYRTTLNKGKDVTTVRKELDNIRSYISIQRLMHAEAFEVVYEVADAILDYTMPNLMLQPLVENAFLHGIDCRDQVGSGCLRIEGYQEKEKILFRVQDNGPGMEQGALERILDSTSESGYGVKNVHQRVQLRCGTGYGLSYESVLGKGTTVILTLPVCKDERRIET